MRVLYKIVVDWLIVCCCCRFFIVIIMAKNTSLVLLGYDDEQISEKHISLVDYTTNKIGGKPVSSLPCIFNPICKSKQSLTDSFLTNSVLFCSFFLAISSVGFIMIVAIAAAVCARKYACLFSCVDWIKNCSPSSYHRIGQAVIFPYHRVHCAVWCGH